ncbi:MAG: hypothetical protein K2R98_28800 [Gemmataceae bacterium]|nr:hypothetical protein [Gemmataceae bacterium]
MAKGVSPPPPSAKPASAAIAKPAPVAKPADLEAFAAAALSDAPPPKVEAPVPSPTTVDFKCPQCDEDVKVSVSLAGKQAPCPACKRIVKVPVLKKEGPIDWRKPDAGLPSGARRDTDAAPEGAWGTVTDGSRVGQSSLKEAGAIPEKVEPKTWGQRLKWPIVVAAVLLLGFGGWMWVKAYYAEGDQYAQVEKALNYAEGKAGTKPLEPLLAAEIYRAGGEVFIQDKPEVARQYFQTARGKLNAAEPSPDRDAVAAEMAIVQADLVLDQAQINKATMARVAEKQQLQAFDDVQRSLRLIGSAETRAEAIRQVSRKLIARGLGDQTSRMAAASHGDDGPEAAAMVGLEMWKAGKLEDAEKIARSLLPSGAVNPKGPEQKAPPASPSLIALCMVLKKPQEVIDGLKANPAVLQLGRAEGLACLGEFGKARDVANESADWLRIKAAMAAIGLEKNPPDAKDAEDIAKWAAGDGKEMLTTKPEASVIVLRLVRIAVRANKQELASQLAEAIPEPLRQRARLEVLRGRLEHSTVQAAAADAVQVSGEPNSLSSALAHKAIARHNTRLGQKSATSKLVDSWPETLRPFGHVGIALGIQDRK